MPLVKTIPDSDAYNWIIGPVTRCIQSVVEGAKLSGLLRRAVMCLASQESLLNQVEVLVTAVRNNNPMVEAPASSESQWTKWSKELLANDLHEVYLPGIIALWASLEVAVEDTATLILLNDHQAQVDAVNAGIKLPSGCPTPLDEFNARRVFGRLEQVSRLTRDIGEAYAHVLGTLGISMSVATESLETLAELNYVRNCILHRGGVVDWRVSEEAAKIGLAVGDEVHITEQDYFRYYEAVGSFAQAMLVGTIASRHIRTKPSEP